MAKTTKSKKGRFRSGGGRITLKPCTSRAEGEYCAPLNHITTSDAEYWTCSCGRRYSGKSYKEFVKSNPGWPGGGGQ